jgi:hypothetical protein
MRIDHLESLTEATKLAVHGLEQHGKLVQRHARADGPLFRSFDHGKKTFGTGATGLQETRGWARIPIGRRSAPVASRRQRCVKSGGQQ